MRKEHQAKVNKLIKDLASSIKDTCRRLYHSGGIDPEAFKLDEYVLAKILVTAATKQHQDDYAPEHNAAMMGITKNLKHF